MNQSPRPRSAAQGRRRRKRKPNISLFLARTAVAAVIALLMLAVISAVFFLFVLPSHSGGNSAESPSDSIPQEPLANSPSALPIETVPVESIPGYAPKPDFISNLDEYEMYMNPIGDEYLFLVNQQNTLDESYKPDDLIDVINTRKDIGRETQQMRLYAAKALEALFIEMYAAGYTDVTVTSAYRPYAYQKQLFDNRVKQYMHLGYDAAYKKASTINAIPGTSEHQTGLCCDMHNLPAADVAFAKQEAATWLKNNAHKFGFILRYAEEKFEYTQISFEPWHFRYVGRYHATAMFEAGLCLEEYVAQRKGG